MVKTPIGYQLFVVEDANGSSLLADNTCGQGALAVIDFVNVTLGLPLVGVSSVGELPITTVRLSTKTLERVGDEEEGAIAKYYGDAEAVGAGGGIVGWFRHALDVIRA